MGRRKASRTYYCAKPSPTAIALHRFVQRADFFSHGQDHWWRLAGNGSNERQRDLDTSIQREFCGESLSQASEWSLERVKSGPMVFDRSSYFLNLH